MRFLTPIFFFSLPIFSFAQFAPESVLNISCDGGTMVRTFDCDSDGDQDVLASMSEGVFLFKNDGTGAMSTPKVIKRGWVTALDAADFDGDGIKDIVAAADVTLFYMKGTGNGNYSAPDTAYLAMSYLQNFTTLSGVDMDGDGDQDLLTSSPGTETVYWYENNGAGLFTVEHPVYNNTGWDPTSVFAADFDNDGDKDLVYCFNTNEIMWNENLGSGNFGNGTILGGLQSPEAVYAADMDGDGDQDILAASRGDNTIAWFRNDLGGVFTGIVISTTADYSYDLVTSDIDGDGDLDILCSGEFKTAWYENLGSGNFGSENIVSTYTTTGGIRSIAIADLDNNSNPDFVTISTNNYPRVLSFPNNGGTFGTPRNILAPAVGINSMVTMDIDNDGYQDILTTSYTDDRIAFHRNLGNGEFTPQQMISSLANGPKTILTADIDGDQLTDIISASSLDNKIAWYKNTGSGQFGAQQVISSSITGIENIDAADLDNDGDIDIVAAFENMDRYIWFENLGAGSFSAMKFISGLNAVNAPRRICAADIDGDGIKDVIGASYDDWQVRWYKKNGVSWINHFITTENDVSSICAGDVDNDGDNDIILTGRYDGELILCKNPGNGTFTTAVVVANGISQVWDADLVDVDLDGDLDIVSSGSDYYQNGVCWFENNGNGQFERRVVTEDPLNYSTYVKVVTADFDNDGDQDVLSAVTVHDQIVLYKNEILAPFQARGNFYIDANQNGQRDSLEAGIALPNIISTPNDLYHYTFDNGRYSVDFDPTVTTNYELTPSDYPHWGITSDSLSYHVAVNPGFVFEDSLDFGFYPMDLFDSLTPNITGEFPRCNSVVSYWLSFKNDGTTHPSGIMELVLDPTINFISADIAPDSIVSNHYYWSYDSLDWFSTTGVQLQVGLPGFNSMGDTLSSYLTVSSDVSTPTSYSFSDQLDQIIVCAYDPNDKSAEPMGFGPEGFILPDVEYIDYTIRFQNTGNDTSVTVVVRDQLDTNFVWNSLTTLASSHPVETTVSASGEVQFNFEQIFLPDSIVNEPASHGFVKYRIWLKEGLPIGTSLQNTANIYFDYNPAVVTNTTTHTLYECQSLDLQSVTTATCEGTDLQGMVNNALYDDIAWKINGIFDIHSDEFTWYTDTSGIFNLQLSRSNPYCYDDTTISITISPIYEQVIDSLQICSGAAINIFGNMESTTGNYYNTLTSSQGCDSTLIIHLQVNSNPLVEISSFLNDTICVESSSLITVPNATPAGGFYSGNGVTGNSFNPVIAGTGIHVVSYTYEDSFGCSNSDSTVITVETCLGLIQNQSFNWNIYPNPAITSLFIETNEATSVTITDLTGKTILSDTLKSGKNELNVSFLTKGVYYIQSESGVNVKFVKQ